MRTFLNISPRVLKFSIKPPNHIWTKIGGQQNWYQKVNFFKIFNIAVRIVHK